ncbi:MAG: phage holin family protein [Rhizobiaceae bacterium]|nr:phage holin family protein [Rhizobiaceae bacterium]MBL4696233.1 phage holin family protein [Rhizobiaceae bacterium]MBL4732711.1 phage holin family protein [Rhizobiaceae bacterium]
MNRISRNISIIVRTERLIAQRRFSVLRRQTGFMVAAGVVAGIGLVMLNTAAYFALAESMSQANSALIVSLVNIAIAVILFIIANKINADREVEAVAELRDMAIEELEMDMNEAAEEVKAVVQSVRNMARDPFGAIAPGMLGTIASVIIKSLKK